MFHLFQMCNEAHYIPTLATTVCIIIIIIHAHMHCISRITVPYSNIPTTLRFIKVRDCVPSMQSSDSAASDDKDRSREVARYSDWGKRNL